MHNDRRVAIVVFVILGVAGFLLSISATPVGASASSDNARIFTVIVSRYGFNETAGSFSITVQQGDLVRITFVYGDNDLTVDNPHAIMFDGYRIQTVNIGKSNPSVTVEFVADVSGSFNFYCYIPCLGMENLLGHLIVAPTQSELPPTTLSLSVSNVNTQPNSFQITATVADENGKPLTGVPVRFYENTTFGKLFLATETTDSEGLAALSYVPSRSGNIQIIAENPGGVQYASSSKSVLITVASATSQPEGEIYLGVGHTAQSSALFYGIAYPPNLSMIGVPRLTNIFVVVLTGIVILGVWSTYAYVARQITTISKQGEPVQPIVEPYIPGATIPAQTNASIDLGVASGWKNSLGLLLLTPTLGVADVMLLNAMHLPILWTALSLVSVAAIETGAITQLLSSRQPRN